MILKVNRRSVQFVVHPLQRMSTLNTRCVLGAMHSLFLNRRNFNIFKKILHKFRQWLNKSDAPKYLSGKKKLK